MEVRRINAWQMQRRFAGRQGKRSMAYGRQRVILPATYSFAATL